MKVTQVLPIFGLLAAVQASYNQTEVIVWTTKTVQTLTTYCPEATSFTIGTKTYTATASETLTITDCPCTVSHSQTIKPTPYPTPTPSYTYVPPPAHHNATWVPPVWITTTETVSEYTTYCPVPTTISQGSKTYTVTEATTLTISECPCTISKTIPASYSTVTIGYTTSYCPSSTEITTGGTTYSVTSPGHVTIPVYTTTIVPVTTSYGTAPAGVPTYTAPASYGTSVTTTKRGPTPTTAPLQVTNAAHKDAAGFGALAAAGLAAMLL